VKSAESMEYILTTIASEMARSPERLVPLDTDWPATYRNSLNELGILRISEELHDHFEQAP
jgi:hypothetical protein